MFTKDIQTLIKEAIEEEKQIKKVIYPEHTENFIDYFTGYKEGFDDCRNAYQKHIDNFLVKMINNGLRQIMEINHEIGAYGVMQNNDPIVRLANKNDCLIYKLIISIRDSKQTPPDQPDTSPESYNIDLSNIDNENIELPF